MNANANLRMGADRGDADRAYGHLPPARHRGESRGGLHGLADEREIRDGTLVERGGSGAKWERHGDRMDGRETIVKYFVTQS
jgi:hypothetical protein